MLARAQRGQDDNNMPMFYYRYVENYQTMGILPSLADVPKSAIIGVATVEKMRDGLRVGVGTTGM